MQLCQHPATNCLKSIPTIVLQEAFGRTIDTKQLDLLLAKYPANVVEMLVD